METHSNIPTTVLHWGWHVVGLMGVLLLGSAVALSLAPADQSMFDRARRDLTAVVCLLPGVMAFGLWLLRRPLSRDWRATSKRWRHRPVPAVQGLIPSVQPRSLHVCHWVSLVWWVMWVFRTLTIDDRLAARWTIENGLLQNVTVICYVAAAALLLGLIRQSRRRAAMPGLGRWWLLTLAVGCLGVAGEEINWGQSLLHYGTPEFLAHTNIQQEVSLHNIELPGLPGRHWSNEVLRGIALVGGAVLPLLLFTSRAMRTLCWNAEVPLPPWVSQAYFFAAALIPRDGTMLGQLSRDNIPSELREVTIAFSMLIWAWALWRQRGTIPVGPMGHRHRDDELDETRMQPA